jgi:hypothetical protein
MTRGGLLVAGPLLIVLGLIQAPMLTGRVKSQDMRPVDVHVDVFSDKTSTQFSVKNSGYYGVSFVVSQSKPYNEVYCMLRSPADYWSPVVCEKGVSFMAGWVLSENYFEVQHHKMDRSSAGIASFEDGGNKYMRRYLGTLYAEKGRNYTLNLTLDGADVGLRGLGPRLQVTIDEGTVETRAWLALWALICVPSFVLGGLWLIVKGFRTKPEKFATTAAKRK